MEFSLENMCRTCLNEGGMMYSIFNKENQIQRNQSYADMLMTCASVKVNEEDGLPKFICEQCMKQLIVSFCFKEQSEQSYATLREITKNPSIEFIKEEAPEAYTDITAQIQVDFVQQKSMKQEQGWCKDAARIVRADDAASEEFKLSREFLNDNIVLDYDVVDVKQCNITNTSGRSSRSGRNVATVANDDIITNAEYGDARLDVFKSDVVKPCVKRNSNNTQLKRVKMPGRGRVVNNKSGSASGKHDDDMPLICPYCEHRFREKQEFRRHKRTHILSYRCDLCEKQFRSSHGLAYHTKIHQGIKNFVCHFANCNRRFTLKQALQKHLSVHTQEKNHLCSECGKAYGTYDALHYHLRTHRGERPYLCMHCGKTFKQSCHLKSHMWVHNGIKPHVCTTCGKCYTSGHQLKKHLTKYCNNNIKNIIINNSSGSGSGVCSASSNRSATTTTTTSTTSITITDEQLLAVINN